MAVPAWKKLGLKLKPSTPETAAPSPSLSTSSQPRPPKRLPEAPIQSQSQSSSNKKPRTQTDLPPGKAVRFNEPSSQQPARPKPALQKETTPRTQPQSQPKKQNKKAKEITTIAPALAYLSQWSTARSAWKFNKNHQSTLTRHIFDPALFPAPHAPTFYAYIADLQGFTRSRLRDAAAELRAGDSSSGAAGFPEGTADVAEKQLKYEAVLGRVLHGRGKEGDENKAAFDEVRFCREAEDGEDGQDVVRRVVRRMRAQMVLDALDGAGEPSTGTRRAESVREAATVVTGLKKPAKTDGPGKRRRKLRVNEDSESSSSSESSESDTSEESSDEEDSNSDED